MSRRARGSRLSCSSAAPTCGKPPIFHNRTLLSSSCGKIRSDWKGFHYALPTGYGRDTRQVDWYRFRLQVTTERIRTWIDDKQVIDVLIGGRPVSMRPGEIKLSEPFGFASYGTTGGIKKIEYRTLAAT